MLAQRGTLTLRIWSVEQYQASWHRLHHIDVGRQHRVHGWLMSGEVHVGKKIESIGDVAISGFFQHHTLILLIGADFVARSVLRVCECHETTFQSSVFGRE